MLGTLPIRLVKVHRRVVRENFFKMALFYLEGIEQRPDLSVALMQNIDSLFSNLEKLSSW